MTTTNPPIQERSANKAQLRERSIKTQLTWLFTVPWILMAVVLVIGSSSFVYDAIYTKGVGSAVRQMSIPAVSALESLQRERLLSMEATSKPGSNTLVLQEQQGKTDGSLAIMNEAAGSVIASAPDDMQRQMTRLTSYFDRLPEIRSRVAANNITTAELEGFYNGMFDAAGQLFELQARVVPQADTLQVASAAPGIFRVADQFAREATLVSSSLNVSQMTPAQHHQFARMTGVYRTQIDSWVGSMMPETRAQYDRLMSSQSWQQVQNLENQFLQHGPFTNKNMPPVDPAQWRAATEDVQNQLNAMVRSQADLVSQRSVSDGDEAVALVALVGGITVILAVAFFLVSRHFSRRIVDDALVTRLKSLSDESDAMKENLMGLIDRLNAGEQVNPADELPNTHEYGNDEVGRLATAIRLFQNQAVHSAVGETKARQGARAVFEGMAHRQSALMKRLSKNLTQAQHNEENPQQLSLLFNADHTVTQARRNLDNLLVLAGQHAGRRWNKPNPLRDVLRAATQEIDHYNRVDIGHSPNVAVSGPAVADTVHLVSELASNATAFSPPETRVQISAQHAARGVVVVIDDAGLGMAEHVRQKANDMMLNPPEFEALVHDSDKVEQLGLFTAARLAHRRGIIVEFGTSAFGGTRATILLPTEVLISLDRDTPSNGNGATIRGELTGAFGSAQSQQAEEPSMPQASGWAESPASGQPDLAGRQHRRDPRASSPRRQERPPLPQRDPGTHLELDEETTTSEEIVAKPDRLAGFHQAFRDNSKDKP